MNFKQLEQSRLFLMFCQVLALGLLAFCFHRTNQINELIKDPANLKQFKVLEVYCRGAGGSTIKIDFEGQEQIVSIRRKLCYSLAEGDFVELYYHQSADFFYEPGNRKYERGIYGLLVFLLWSIIPWRKLFKRETMSIKKAKKKKKDKDKKK